MTLLKSNSLNSQNLECGMNSLEFKLNSRRIYIPTSNGGRTGKEYGVVPQAPDRRSAHDLRNINKIVHDKVQMFTMRCSNVILSGKDPPYFYRPLGSNPNKASSNHRSARSPNTNCPTVARYIDSRAGEDVHGRLAGSLRFPIPGTHS